jgi:hypothetical protein
MLKGLCRGAVKVWSCSEWCLIYCQCGEVLVGTVPVTSAESSGVWTYP